MKALLKKLDTIIDLLLADREERRQEKELKVSAENDARLIEYAKSKKKLMPTGGIYTSNELGERPMNIGGDLIPTNLSPQDRALLDEFYNH
jgi:hypothetical protein